MNNAINSDKREFILTNINNRTDPKKFWESINAVHYVMPMQAGKPSVTDDIAHNTNSLQDTLVTFIKKASILGPFMLLIHINDMNRNLNLASTKRYADDTSVTISGMDPPTFGIHMQQELIFAEQN